MRCRSIGAAIGAAGLGGLGSYVPLLIQSSPALSTDLSTNPVILDPTGAN